MSKYNEFREKYPLFIYNSYEIKINEDNIFITYNFEIENLKEFKPTLEIPINKDVTYNLDVLEKLVFNIGMAELISYWKATCSPKVSIKCGYLTTEQKRWWKKLYFYGLAEMFYINNITNNIEDFMDIDSTQDKKHSLISDSNKNYDGYLVPVGGGKDSIVSLEVLKSFNNKKAFIINNRQVCFDSAKIAGNEKEDIINVKRIFDRGIIDLNSEGYLNGHTPLSANIAFIAYLTAYLYNFKYVVLSNESSANEPSIKGTKINHQYSKSFEFEEDFRYYTNKYLNENIEYFSLLRPISELQIMNIFSKYPKYFNDFISCNNGGKRKNIGKSDGWCLNCSKCLFIYIILSNFITDEQLISIFSENLLEKKEMLPIFIDLIGKSKSKPFECVGTIEEVNYVVINKIKSTAKLPFLYQYYKDNYELVGVDENILKRYGEENNLPKDLEIKLKEYL